MVSVVFKQTMNIKKYNDQDKERYRITLFKVWVLGDSATNTLNFVSVSVKLSYSLFVVAKVA